MISDSWVMAAMIRSEPRRHKRHVAIVAASMLTEIQFSTGALRHHRGARAARRTWRRLPLRRRLPENASHAVQLNSVFVAAARHKNVIR